MDKLSRFSDLDVVTGPAWPGVSYFCSTRQGGVSQGPWASLNIGPHTGDDPDHVAENRRRLAPRNLPVFWLSQVHGTDVHDVDAPDAPDAPDALVHGESGHRKSDRLVQADALVTACRDQVLAIMTADCLPVVIGSADGRVLGLAHAGWRGLSAGVLENTLDALRAKYDGSGAPHWRAWIGPGIGPSRFEVGDDVRTAFVDDDPDTVVFFKPAARQGKWLADLAGIARHRLQRSDVSRVDISPWCTYSFPDLFYSYRRDGVTGRIATLAWLNGGERNK